MTDNALLHRQVFEILHNDDLDELAEKEPKLAAVQEAQQKLGACWEEIWPLNVQWAAARIARARALAVLERGKTGPKLNDHMSSNSPYAQAIEQCHITIRQAQRCAPEGKISDERFARMIAEFEEAAHDGNLELISAALLQKLGKNPMATYFTGATEWYTPSVYIESARKAMGSIDLDPASNQFANQVVQAEQYFSLEEGDDGLLHPWFGNVFCNPPYAAKPVADFADKLLKQWQAQNITQCIFLVNNVTDTRWFQRLTRECFYLCLTGGRISFYNKEGEATSPTNGQAFFYFGDSKRFAEIFAAHGVIVKAVE